MLKCRRMPIALAVISLLFLVGSQQALAQQTRLGIKAAWNLAWFTGGDWNDLVRDLDNLPGIDADNEVNSGFTGGVFAEFNVAPRLSIQTEILLGTVSGGVEFTDGVNTASITERATVLKLPLLLKPKFDVASDGALYLLAGPTPAFIIGDIEAKLRETGFATETVEYEPDKRFVFSATFGAGYEHRFDTGALNGEICYNRTFTDIYDDFESRINSFSFYVGYGFNL